MATLQVLICTFDSGINKIAKLIPEIANNISYLISWQQSNPNTIYTLPPQLQREDIEIHTLNNIGLSRNRNNSLKNASGDICLISDDDVKLYPDGLQQIISTFEQNSDLDLATFRYHSTDFPKFYPEYSFNLNEEPKFYYTTSFEIAFRRTSIIDGQIKFNELFGLGAPVLCAGEENIFILQSLRHGLTSRFYPITIAEHNHPTTGVGKLTPQLLMSNGAYIYYRYTNHYRTRILRVATGLLIRKKINIFYSIKHLLAGAKYIKTATKSL